MSGPDRTVDTATTVGGATGGDDSEGDAFVRRVIAAPAAAAPVALVPDTIVAETYRVMRRLGAGGMGVVYLAHDRRLKRDVALKLHAAATGERLEREATAIAQLVHPNVVTVYQVGRHDGAVYVAMEYVDGGTARTWLAERRRSWRDVIAIYLGAARGLAAAHRAGMVHRDFKPENLLIGRDGRVRVADFGLARDVGARDVAAEAGAGRLSPLTATGAVMGTPAYMAPEQYAGAAVGPAADQFALCASLWEALYGARPFAGGDVATLAAAVAAGTIAAPADERGVPRRIRRVLERGLSADPARRFASMEALAGALVPGRSRGAAIAIGATVLAVAAAGAAYAARPHHAGDPCRDAAAVIDRELPPALIAELRHTIAGAGPADVVARLDALLAGTRPTLAGAARAACRADRVEHALSPMLAERAVACVAVRARATAILVGDRALATSDPSAYGRRLRAIPPLEPCLDPVSLSATPGRLDDGAIRVRALLWAAVVELETQRSSRARELLAQARAALAPDDAGGHAMELAVEGRLAYLAHDYDGAARLLGDAYYAGQAVDDPVAYLTALSALIVLYTGERYDSVAVAPWLRTAQAVIQKDRARAPVECAAVLAALSTAADVAGDSEAAVRYAEAVTELTASFDESPLQIDAQSVLAHALAGAGRLAEAVAPYQRAIAESTDLEGADRPNTLSLIAALGLVYLDSGRHAEAAAIAERLEAGLARIDHRGMMSASALLDLGVLLTGPPETAARAAHAYQEARAIYVELEGADHPDVQLCDGNLALLANLRGDHREALALFEQVLAAQVRTIGADHPDVAGTQFNIAAAALAAGEPARAEAAAGRAATIYAATEPGTRRHVFALVLRARALAALGRGPDALAAATAADRLARALADDPESGYNTSLEIARAELVVGRDRTDAERRLTAARAGLAALPEPSPERLADIDALLATLR